MAQLVIHWMASCLSYRLGFYIYNSIDRERGLISQNKGKGTLINKYVLIQIIFKNHEHKM